MSAWHLRTLSPTTIFDTPGVGQNIAIFHDEFVSMTFCCRSDISYYFGLFIDPKFRMETLPFSFFSRCNVNIAEGSLGEEKCVM